MHCWYTLLSIDITTLQVRSLVRIRLECVTHCQALCKEACSKLRSWTGMKAMCWSIPSPSHSPKVVCRFHLPPDCVNYPGYWSAERGASGKVPGTTSRPTGLLWNMGHQLITSKMGRHIKGNPFWSPICNIITRWCHYWKFNLFTQTRVLTM